MRDGRWTRLVKFLSRRAFFLQLALGRAIHRMRGNSRYELVGECVGCGRCCERPSIQVGRIIWYLPLARRAFLRWHERINGFVFEGAEREGRVLTFRCMHFDPVTRRCDSYGSRPGACRDYPRLLIYQPWPEFFAECGFRPLVRNREEWRRALAASDLDQEQLEELQRKLFLR